MLEIQFIFMKQKPDPIEKFILFEILIISN